MESYEDTKDWEANKGKPFCLCIPRYNIKNLFITQPSKPRRIWNRLKNELCILQRKLRFDEHFQKEE
eukprot:g18152.t1